VVTFQSRRGALSFTVSQSEPEGLSLFDRARRRQVCLYAAPGTEVRYDEDDLRDIDVLHHDLSVRFEPDRFGLVGSDTLRIRLRSPASTIRLRLDEALKVISIRSREGGDHLFFRVRHQDGMIVSLGTLSGTVGEITLTVRFAGNQRPQSVEREAMQTVAPSVGMDDELGVEEALVYSNGRPGIRREKPTTTRRRSSTSTCPRVPWPSPGASRRHCARRPAARASNTGRSCPANTSRSRWAGSSRPAARCTATCPSRPGPPPACVARRPRA
jgi:hypothetical protein